jgi:hypothetical protein
MPFAFLDDTAAVADLVLWHATDIEAFRRATGEGS